jgi:hypothetical protein
VSNSNSTYLTETTAVNTVSVHCTNNIYLCTRTMPHVSTLMGYHQARLNK